MIIKQDFSMFLSAAVILAFMILAAKYIYCEKCYTTRRAWIIFGMVFLSAELGAMFIPGESGELFMILFLLSAFSIMIVTTRKSRRIRGLFLILPVLGIVLSIEMIPEMILLLFTGKVLHDLLDRSWVYEFIYDITAFIFIYKWLKKYFIGPKMELGLWERRILNGNGLLLLIIYCISVSIPEILVPFEKYLLAGCAFICVMITGSSIVMTMKSSQAQYFKTMAELNEYFLQAQVSYFKSYQNTHHETRRIKHDMKNHILCARDLYDRREYEKLGKYLEGIIELTQPVCQEYHIGNDIADAILNQKYASARQLGIDFSVEGTLAGIAGISLTDICTIFANALDNAMEAVIRADIPEAVITITIKREKRFLYISFTNPCTETTVNIRQAGTSKKDRVNHGFGMENIGKAVDKYKGSTQVHIAEDKDGGNLFCLELMLMI